MVFRKLLERKLRSLKLKRERVVRLYDRRLKHIAEELARLNKEYASAPSGRAAEIRERLGRLHVQEVFTRSYRVSEPREMDVSIRKIEARLSRPSLGERFRGWLKNRRRK